jgi:hypothetical protein
MSPLLPLLVLHAALAASPAPAERRYVPCPEGSPRLAEARKRFEALDARVSALPDEADTGPVVAELEAVLGSRCFELSREEWTRPESGVHALALKAWWREGGRAWVGSYLELGKPDVRTILLPPAVRAVLAKETVAADHWLSGLLCSVGDAGCGAETRGWHECLEDVFRQDVERRRSAPPVTLPPGLERPDCVAKARSEPRRWRYTAWRSCVSSRRPYVWGLPIARLKAPEEGWLVLRGRRGHYAFCDEVRAYHLRTGAAYISESCYGLEPAAAGEYRGVRCPDPKNPQKAWLRVGTLAPDKARELAWVLMLGAEASSLHREAQSLNVPEGFPVEWREKVTWEGSVEGFVMGGVFSGHSGQTRLDWTWFSPGGGALSGNFTYPDPKEPAEAYANFLLRRLEATFTEGCPPLPPPLEELTFSRPSAYARPVDKPWEVDARSKERIDALREWRPPASCPAAPDAGP